MAKSKRVPLSSIPLSGRVLYCCRVPCAVPTAKDPTLTFGYCGDETNKKPFGRILINTNLDDLNSCGRTMLFIIDTFDNTSRCTMPLCVIHPMAFGRVLGKRDLAKKHLDP